MVPLSLRPRKKDPAATFKELVRANFRGALKAPFNDVARAEAGLTPSFYRSLSPTSSLKLTRPFNCPSMQPLLTLTGCNPASRTLMRQGVLDSGS